MSLTIGDNFSYNGAKPLDARLTYSTLAEMANKADSTLYNGILAYCVATDKTYQWKSTNPVDPDTGRWREFSSGGGEGQTIQVAELPAASEDEEGKIYQYIGADTSTLTHGYYYECVSDGEDPATYSWEPKEVQDTPEAMSQNDVEEIINGLVIDPLDMPEPMTQSDVEEVKNAFSPTGYNPFTIGIGGGYAPIGTIIQYMGVTAPQDYLVCDGTVYNIADYPQLAEFFTAQFGAANHFGGDGTTTFAVPDLRGEFLRGTGTNSHANQGNGAAVGTHQDSTLFNGLQLSSSSKRIQMQSDTDWKGLIKANQDSTITTTGKDVYVDGSSGNISSDKTVDRSTIRPTNTSVLYCIKAIVAGEVYSTEERVVGTWIDGRKIYQKTVECGGLPNAAAKDISTGLSNVNVYDYFGVAYRPSDGARFHFPIAQEVDKLTMVSIRDNGSRARIVTHGDMTAYTECYITIRYTKTA